MGFLESAQQILDRDSELFVERVEGVITPFAHLVDFIIPGADSFGIIFGVEEYEQQAL